MNVIQTENLSKRFGDTKAVDKVSINVEEGEIYGFLGLNGAGKTTAIRLLLGMIRPDGGSFSLFGRHPKQSSQIWNDVGYLVETPHAYPDLSVKENLELFVRLRGLSDFEPVNEIIDKLHLSQYKNKKAKHLSLGNNQRLGLAKALMHKPKLLILDEPINGLDPAGIVEVRELLKDLVDNHGTTIFLSSHILSEISKLADRIGIVHQGRLIKEINSEELEKQVIKKLYIDTLENTKALKVLRDLKLDAAVNGNGFIEIADTAFIEHPEKSSEILVGANLPPKMLRVYEEDLESYFLRMIGREV